MDKAFDGDITTKWLTLANTGWIAATVLPGSTVDAYSMTSAEDVPGRDPQTWTIEGNGSSWTFCGSGSGYFLNRNETRAWPATDPTSYGVYRLNILANNGDPYTQLAELRFYQFNSVPSAGNPEVVTAPANEVNYTTANFNGQAAPNSTATTAWFQWGLTLLLPAGASLNGVGPTNSILDRLIGGDANKLVVLNDTANVVALITPAAAAASVVKGFELIGGDDDASFPSREPSSFTLEGSTNGIDFVVLASVNPVAPTANMQIQGYSILGNTNGYKTYRATFGAPQSGNVLQVGELRLFGTPVTFPPPVLSVRATPLVYVEGDGLVAIDRTLTLSDTNTTTLTGATVQITGNYQSDQDVLGFVNTPQITGSFAPANGTLTLTGTTTVANYQAALRTVTYQNTSGYPFGAFGLVDTGDALSTARTVTWTVTDDQPASGSNTNSITVNVNSAPVITSAGNFAFINGNSQDVNIPHYFGLSFADVDAFDSPFIDFEIAIR